MLSRTQIAVIAESMYARLGEVAVAAAMLKSQRALDRGDTVKAASWRRIAEAIDGGNAAQIA